LASYLIGNTRIRDGTDQAPFTGAVRVEGSRITAVTAGAPPPAGGATLTRLPPEEPMLLTARNARTMLDCGYTSAFSAGAPKPRLDVVLKREIEAGRVPGPRPLANGPEMTVTGGLGDTNVLHLPQYDTPTLSERS